MLPFIQSVLNLFLRWDKCRVDSYVSRLHYGITSVILLAFSIFLTSSLDISCQSSYYLSAGPSENQLNSFCVVGPTYIDSHEATISDSDTFRGKTSVHVPQFYQYQTLLFCLIAISFYFPKLLWSLVENNRTEKIVKNLGQPVQE